MHNVLTLNREEAPLAAPCDAAPLYPARNRENQRKPGTTRCCEKAAEKAGGKIHAWYWTMGQYDAVLISEFPTDEAGAKFALSVGALGNVTTETLKAFTETEYRKIVGGLS